MSEEAEKNQKVTPRKKKKDQQKRKQKQEDRGGGKHRRETEQIVRETRGEAERTTKVKAKIQMDGE